MQTQDEYSESLAGLALGSLRASETRTVDEHLKDCPVCRAEYEKWQNVAASIAYCIEPRQPPARARATLMKAIAAETGHKPGFPTETFQGEP